MLSDVGMAAFQQYQEIHLSLKKQLNPPKTKLANEFESLISYLLEIISKQH